MRQRPRFGSGGEVNVLRSWLIIQRRTEFKKMPEINPVQIEFLKNNIMGFEPDDWTIAPAGSAGSDRRFLRVSKTDENHISFILILWNSSDEDWARFLTIGKDLCGISEFLPQIYSCDEKYGLILEEDLGMMTLKQYCIDYPAEKITVYMSVIDALIEWQNMPVTSSSMISSRLMDMEVFLWESKYFETHCVGDFFGIDKMLDENWENERIAMASKASQLPGVCIHRDFQSENILVNDNRIRFVDYQGARTGPAGYDLASLLFDPYIGDIDNETRNILFGYYLSKSSSKISPEDFYVCSLQRLMQALGAYGNLSINKGKLRYRQFIPVAIDRCIFVAEKLSGFPKLLEILNACRSKTV
jgi:aminoglycoside/choline kinase family phosphotransferase